MLTLAPGVTLWDSGEFLAAIHALGIPHPPGTPLYVLLGNVWSLLFANLFGFARAINLLSAVCTALGCGILASLFDKWTGDGLGSTAAGITAGLMSTVWMSATETEVYALAVLFGCLILWAGDRAGERSDMRWSLLTAYLAGLAWALHLTALLVLPSAILLVFTTHDGYFAVPVGRRHVDGRRESHSFAKLMRASILVALIGMTSALFLIFRARHDPAINQGNPSTVSALVDVILRRQYDVPSLWPRQAPLYLQLGNLFEYADWQFAKGLAPEAPPSWWRTPITVLYALLGVVGFMAHRNSDPHLARDVSSFSDLYARRRDLSQFESEPIVRSRIPSGERSARSARERLLLFLRVHVLGALGGIRRDTALSPTQAAAQHDRHSSALCSRDPQLDSGGPKKGQGRGTSPNRFGRDAGESPAQRRHARAG